MSIIRSAWHISGLCVILASLLLGLPEDVSAGTMSIAVISPESLLEHAPCRRAVTDAKNLLRQAFPKASVGSGGVRADVRIVLPDLAKLVTLSAQSDRVLAGASIRNESFRWTSRRQGTAIVLRLSAASPAGAANGIYALLQEKLGIRFIHPRQTIMPIHRSWPLPSSFAFAGQPVFASRGFHLHTLHPMELTEQLHDPDMPGAFDDVTAYIDWLARNGQNTFQFFLLRGIDRNRWIPHARRIVEYAHQRGISCGIEISLAMLQQQAFQAITLLRPFPSYRRQVDFTLAWLFQAPWDFVSLEATMGEHLPFLGRFLPDVQSHFERQVVERYRVRLLYATHVIGGDDGEKVRRPNLPTSGILLHTVMCYSAAEPHAPVYGNQNQRFMLEAARTESRKRETWYWPESSYWVAFDSPVPLLVLPYLTARWEDIRDMGDLKLHGHLTFTTGWEWGYWLVDWSIARWSWTYTHNRAEVATSPVSRLNDLFADQVQRGLFTKALTLQERYLKDRELLRYLSALTPFSELPPPLARPFQPDPGFSYGWLVNRAGAAEAEAAVAQPLRDLDDYADRMERLTDALDSRIRHLDTGESAEQSLVRELSTSLRVSSLRARHRAVTIRALLAQRSDGPPYSGRPESMILLDKAGTIRTSALSLVREQELRYRYPREQLAHRRPSLTAYQFGYLYPVTDLFFWGREEGQVLHGRFDPIFMNLWDVRRTLGLESLLFRSGM